MSAAKTLGLVGRKAGMTRVFTDAGESVPVTVIEALPNRITQVRTTEVDGYRALALKTRGKVHLRSRNDKDFTARKAPSKPGALHVLPWVLLRLRSAALSKFATVNALSTMTGMPT